MMTKLISVLFVVALAACGGNGTKPSTTPADPDTSGATGGKTYGDAPTIDTSGATSGATSGTSPADPCVTP